MKHAIEVIRAKSSGQAEPRYYDITINFHPDRFTTDGLPLLQAIANDQCLKSQFETGTSNGGLTAISGGNRWKWEHRVFDGAYDHCAPNQRPKYGALNYKNLETGAAPRFGSAFFRLKPHVIERTTFCYPDSYFEPEHFATFEYLAALIKLADADTLDELDAYIEAQIHGEITLINDVEAIVLDPVFQGTDIEDQAKQLPIKLQWHTGFEVETNLIAKHPEYRGQHIVDLSKAIAVNGSINPVILGDAANHSGHNPQDIKKVWHYLVKLSKST